VLSYLHGGKLDPNWEELKKERSNGSYYPFKTLDDSQVYWLLRPRPSHETISKGGDSIMSLEFRSPDISVDFNGMHMMNRFVIGLCQYISEHGADGVNAITQKDDFNQFLLAGKYGFNNPYVDLKKSTRALTNLACKGLPNDEAYMLSEQVEGTIVHGNDAQKLRHRGFRSPKQLEDFLVESLRGEI